jgi:hypothetical protein
MGISLIGPPPDDTGNIMNQAAYQDTGNILNQSAGPAPNQSAPRAPTPVVRPGQDYNQQAVREGIANGRFIPPPPPPPPPRPFRDAEQERIEADRKKPKSLLDLLTGNPDDAGTGNILDLGTAESQERARKSQLDLKPPTDEELGNYNAASLRAGQKTDLAAEGGNLNQLAAHSYNPDSGGYQFFTKDEYDRLMKNRPKGALQMQDISGTDGSGRSGMYVYMSGATSLTADNVSASQSQVWSTMAPTERREYLNAVGALGSLRGDAPQRLAVALHANDIAVSAQHRFLINELKAGVKPKDIPGGFFNAAKDMSYKASGSVEWDQVPNFIVWQEALPNGQLGFKSIKPLSEVYDSVLHDVETNRYMAGELVVAMLAANMIKGATAKYAGDFIGFDASGKPIAQWNPADWNDDLRVLVQEVAKRQAAGAQVGTSMDSFWQVVKNTAQYNDQTIKQTAGSYPGSNSGGGGGGGGSRYYRSGYGGGGGGGGAYVQRSFQSDPTALAAQLDSIARARLGRSATQEERDAFIAQFHALEATYSQAYNTGGVAMQPDPQGQAVAFIEQHASGEQAAQTSGEFITALADFIRGPGLHKGA